jgi:hypothetical protein
VIPLDRCHADAWEGPLHGRGHGSDHCDILVIANDFRGNGDRLVLFVGQSKSSTDFGVDAFEQLPIPVFREKDDFVVFKLIAIVVVCQDDFSFC